MALGTLPQLLLPKLLFSRYCTPMFSGFRCTTPCFSEESGMFSTTTLLLKAQLTSEYHQKIFILYRSLLKCENALPCIANYCIMPDGNAEAMFCGVRYYKVCIVTVQKTACLGVQWIFSRCHGDVLSFSHAKVIENSSTYL